MSSSLNLVPNAYFTSTILYFCLPLVFQIQTSLLFLPIKAAIISRGGNLRLDICFRGFRMCFVLTYFFDIYNTAERNLATLNARRSVSAQASLNLANALFGAA